MRTICCLLLFTILLFSGAIKGQVPANQIGLNPSKLKWNQINTDRVQVIFPKGLEVQGQRVANVVHYLYDNELESVGELRTKVSILLQNQTNVSNGFVTVGPFRSEFYMTPPQFDQATDWVDLLAIHEYRHVQQYANTQRGITKLVKNVLGSWAWGGLFGTVLPRWYFEGDAVDMETQLSATGRGRQPAFNMQYRSLIQEEKYYNYEKAGAGSLKDFVPSWYPLGYYMTTYGKEQFGNDIWAKVVDESVRYKGLFFPFSNSLKRHTGLSTKSLYSVVRNELDSLWNNFPVSDFDGLPTPTTINNTNKKTVIHYNNPQFIVGNQMIVQKGGYNQINGYYLLDKFGGETKITEPGILLDRTMAPFSAAKNLICWAELSFHPRWRNKNYSIIRVFNVDTKKKFKISSKSRLFAPALSPDAKKIVALEVSESLANQLVIMNAQSGEVIQKIPNPENTFYHYPKWTVDGTQIIAIAKIKERQILQLIDPTNGVVSNLLPPTVHQLSQPFPFGDFIFFSAAFGASNNIYAYHLKEKTLFQVTNSNIGAFQPAVDLEGAKIVYSEFSSEGYNVKSIPFETENWRAIDVESINPQYVKEYLSSNKSILDKVPDEDFPVKKFNKWSGIINPHSILPQLSPPEVGATLLSDNKFSTLSASLGALYNLNEEEFTYSGNLSYAEFFPILNVGYSLANRSASFVNYAPLPDTSIILSNYTEEWRENRLSVGLEVPLNFSQGNFSTNMSFSGNYQWIDVNTDNVFNSSRIFRDTFGSSVVNEAFYDAFADEFEVPLSNRTLGALDLRWRFATFQRRAIQNLNPRFGLNLDLRYRSLVNSAPFDNSVLLARGDLFLPGFSQNHSFVINSMLQTTRYLDNYRFPNLFFYPRGYDAIANDNIFKIGLNYALPIAYPDWNIGPLAFIKRVKANVFFDYAKFDTDLVFLNSIFDDNSLSSTGIELRFDFRALRLLEIDLGVRYSYLIDEAFAPGGRQHQFDFLLISISE